MRIPEAAKARLLVAGAAAVIAAALIALSLGNSSATTVTPKVSVEFGVGTIKVSVALPPPAYYSYYTYYTSTSYYSYYSQPVPVDVVVVVEKLVKVNGVEVPEPVAAGGVYRLEAYGPQNSFTATFHVPPGTYRVKVLFWNSLLPELYKSGSPWNPLAPPYMVVGAVQ